MTRYLKKSKKRKGFCTYCAGPVPPRRRYWCSAECVHEYKLRTSGSYLRRETFKRDKGVCAGCGLDTNKVQKELARLRKQLFIASASDRPTDELLGRLFSTAEQHGIFLDPMASLTELLKRSRATLWNADHIIPVYEGGGACGLENIQTLCRACHQARTAEQAAHRASLKRPRKKNAKRRTNSRKTTDKTRTKASR